ncbi:MAG: sigma 54-interacting transcriptional regulator [Candidatus Binatia bacterium]|nr:sigma 54-interacting transcriptional regulator [Candidatus Binatia bacterium]
MELRITALLEQHGEEKEWTFGPLVGKSVAMQHVFALITKVAHSSATVLIGGESGTGKELVARAIHSLSPRAGHPFVPVNCAAIPEELLESELFGHVRGAFTGAIHARQGRFQLAHGGTLFLDEVGEMSAKLQAKLLRVLQEREFEPIGSERAVQVDVRVIAATNRDLRQAIKEGRFREDLFYRLNVLPIELPPLRERPGDVALLTAYFLQLHSRKKDKGVERVEKEVLTRLERYSWPGNVRELENLMERVVILNESGVVRVCDLPDYICQPFAAQKEEMPFPAIHLPPEGVDLDSLLQEIENRLILEALARTRGNKTLAAELLCLNRTTLVERLRKRGLEPARPTFSSFSSASVRRMTADDCSLTA